MKNYPIQNLSNESYITTLLVNKTMVNVFSDDAGQQYYLQFYDPEEDEIVEYGCGAYETDYKGVAESLFEDPKTCKFFGYEDPETCNKPVCCQEYIQTYCRRCPCCAMVQDRERRLSGKKSS